MIKKLFVVVLLMLFFAPHIFAQDVVVRTDKNSYRPDERMEIVVKNNAQESIFSIAASGTPGASVKYIERQNDSGGWDKLQISCQWPECDTDFDAPGELEAGEQVSFYFYPRTYEKGYMELKDGIYRLTIGLQDRKDIDPGKWVWREVKSPEFRIRR